MKAHCNRCTMTFRVGRRKYQNDSGERLRCPECSVHFYCASMPSHYGPPHRITVSVTKEEMRFRGLQAIEEAP